MAHELYTRTNQKLYFAGLALASLRRAEESRALNAQAQAMAEREAVLFHLHGALLGLCHEIAGFYRLPEAGVPRVERFLDAGLLRAAPSPELAELVELASQPETWLAELLDQHTRLFQPPQAPKKAKVDPRLPLIETVGLDEEEASPLPSTTQLEQWRQSLKDLALRFRESLTEC
ncbi:DUF6586 family protein [Azotobacter vinelandii]|uniref:DUF6586 family protein n=1 Tax=Azotobacter vinelandii TaxID=354 RepID=UPI000773CEFE|nr:DUF6586 family protein [Azotobacter vinelandii]WKN23430.1 PasA protein [Azotobacter vinelandii]